MQSGTSVIQILRMSSMLVPLRSHVPTLRRAFDSKWSRASSAFDKTAAAEKSADYYNQDTHPLPPLDIGIDALVQHPRTKLRDRSGVIMAKNRSWSHQVKLPSGRVLWRNRRFLRPPPGGPLPSIPTVPPSAGCNLTPPVLPSPRRCGRNRRQPARFRLLNYKFSPT